MITSKLFTFQEWEEAIMKSEFSDYWQMTEIFIRVYVHELLFKANSFSYNFILFGHKSIYLLVVETEINLSFQIEKALVQIDDKNVLLVPQISVESVDSFLDVIVVQQISDGRNGTKHRLHLAFFQRLHELLKVGTQVGKGAAAQYVDRAEIDYQVLAEIPSTSDLICSILQLETGSHEANLFGSSAIVGGAFVTNTVPGRLQEEVITDELKVVVHALATGAIVLGIIVKERLNL